MYICLYTLRFKTTTLAIFVFLWVCVCVCKRQKWFIGTAIECIIKGETVKMEDWSTCMPIFASWRVIRNRNFCRFTLENRLSCTYWISVFSALQDPKKNGFQTVRSNNSGELFSDSNLPCESHRWKFRTVHIFFAILSFFLKHVRTCLCVFCVCECACMFTCACVRAWVCKWEFVCIKREMGRERVWACPHTNRNNKKGAI